MDESVLNINETRIGRGLRLNSLRRSLRLSRKAFCEKFGISPYTLQNWETNKNGGLTEKRVEDVANLFKTVKVYCSVEWLRDGTGPAPSIVESHTRFVRENAAYYDASQDALIQKELALFYEHNPNAIHLQITDDGHAPYYRAGDLVAGIRYFDADIASFIGKICIVYTAAGEQLVRQLKAGSSPERYNLICTNADTTVEKPIIYNAEITLAAPILWLRRQ